jgi:hypothetical protein
MDEKIIKLDKKIVMVGKQVEKLTNGVQLLGKNMANILLQLTALNISTQALFDVLMENNKISQKNSIELLNLIIESGDKSDGNNIINSHLQKTVTHLQRQNPLSPEERRKQFCLVENDKKVH